VLSAKTPATGAARAAYCDVDGTLAATTIVTPLLWFISRERPVPSRVWWFATLPFRAPYWLALDRIDRLASNRAIYSNYAGLRTERVKNSATECFRDVIRPRLFPQAVQRLQELRGEGVRVVLVTGGLDFLMQPLAAELQAELVAPGLEEKDGVFTGRLNCPPVAGEAKAEAVRAHAVKNNIDLKASFAYGDAFGDLPMLRCVGNPVAVSPDRRLARIAAENGWRREDWRG
jgi:HAD superfamily hydrolase (TIGR01490 family)